jgi:hypothetical protein
MSYTAEENMADTRAKYIGHYGEIAHAAMERTIILAIREVTGEEGERNAGNDRR